MTNHNDAFMFLGTALSFLSKNEHQHDQLLLNQSTIFLLNSFTLVIKAIEHLEVVLRPNAQIYLI